MARCHPRLAGLLRGMSECEHACASALVRCSLLAAPRGSEPGRNGAGGDGAGSSVVSHPHASQRCLHGNTVLLGWGEHQQVVRGRLLAAAIWSGSRVDAGDFYIQCAQALYRPGAHTGGRGSKSEAARKAAPLALCGPLLCMYCGMYVDTCTRGRCGTSQPLIGSTLAALLLSVAAKVNPSRCAYVALLA
jgi:hypothetical protein